MHRKSESLNRFKLYQAYSQRHTNRLVQSVSFNELDGVFVNFDSIKLKRLRSDNVFEYLSYDFKSFIELNRIKSVFTISYTPQQNKWQKTSTAHYSIQFDQYYITSLCKTVWVRSPFNNRVRYNRFTSLSLPQTLFHIIYSITSLLIYHICEYLDLSAHILFSKKMKNLDYHSLEALLMRYSIPSKGYKLWDADISQFIVSRDVTFDDDIC